MLRWFWGGGGLLCYTTIGVAEEKVVVGHKLFEVDRPLLSSCHHVPDFCLLLRKLLGLF